MSLSRAIVWLTLGLLAHPSYALLADPLAKYPASLPSYGATIASIEESEALLFATEDTQTYASEAIKSVALVFLALQDHKDTKRSFTLEKDNPVGFLLTKDASLSLEDFSRIMLIKPSAWLNDKMMHTLGLTLKSAEEKLSSFGIRVRLGEKSTIDLRNFHTLCARLYADFRSIVFAEKPLRLQGINYYRPKFHYLGNRGFRYLKLGNAFFVAQPTPSQTVLISMLSKAKKEKLLHRADALSSFVHQSFATRKIADAFSPIESVPLWKGKKATLALGFSEDAYMSYPRGTFEAKTIRQRLLLNPKHVIAPKQNGDKVGNLELTLEGKTLFRKPLVALETVEAANPIKRLIDTVRMWWS